MPGAALVSRARPFLLSAPPEFRWSIAREAEKTTWQPCAPILSEQDRREWDAWRRERILTPLRARRARLHRIDYANVAREAPGQPRSRSERNGSRRPGAGASACARRTARIDGVVARGQAGTGGRWVGASFRLILAPDGSRTAVGRGRGVRKRQAGIQVMRETLSARPRRFNAAATARRSSC